MSETTVLWMSVEEPGADEVELDRLALALLEELWEAGVDSVAPVSGAPAARGSKGGEFVTLGALAAQVLPTALPALISSVQAWVLRGSGRTVKLRVQTGPDSVDIQYPVESMSATQAALLVQQLTASLRQAAVQSVPAAEP
jgi:hypothetical protein